MRNWRAIGCALLMLIGSAAVAQDSASMKAPLSPVTEATPLRAAQANAQPTASAAAAPVLDQTDVNAWLDGFMPYALSKGNIPGAVVVVVKNGQILSSRGYGYADRAKGKKVDPALTLFRPGSISKLFTWTAVMQQVEQGKLDLDTDINRYLDFKIPPYQGKPITLRDIMTHTSGFEEQVKDIITSDEKTAVPYDKLLKRWVPHRIFAPGTTPAYSNYATSLAGYIVQRVSKEPFDQYIARHIFAPLGMAHSSFQQPLPANLRPLASNGYKFGQDEPGKYELVGPAPAGSLASTGDDMGKFMIAHLADGRGILQPRTAQLMHSRVAQHIPNLNGMALGFYEQSINGHRVIAHGGDTNMFHSDLFLFPAEQTGLYVSMNSAGKEGAAGALRASLFEGFADRYFPAPPGNPPTLAADQARKNAQLLAGSWSGSRRAQSSFLSITDLLGQIKIGVGKDGELLASVYDQLGNGPRKWVAIGPMLWRDANGHELLSARVENGTAVAFSINSIAPIIVFERTPWYANSSWLLPLLYLSLAILLITVLMWPLRAVVRRRFGAAFSLEGPDLRVFRISRIAAIAAFAVLMLWLVTFTIMQTDVNFSTAFDGWIIFLGILSLVAFVGAFVAALWYAWVVWSRRWTWPAKVWSVLLVIATATVLHLALVYHLINFNANY